MFDLVTVLQCAAVCLDPTTLRQLTVIVPAILAMTGRVTMLGISRWTGKGGSYRTVQRFFNTVINWGLLHWVLVKTHLLDPQDTYILAGDEVVVTKAGHDTHGLNRFFSSLYGKPVPGLAFFAFSLVSVPRRVAYPVRIGQIIRPAAAPEAAPAPTPPQEKKSRGGMVHQVRDKRRSYLRIGKSTAVLPEALQMPHNIRSGCQTARIRGDLAAKAPGREAF